MFAGDGRWFIMCRLYGFYGLYGFRFIWFISFIWFVWVYMVYMVFMVYMVYMFFMVYMDFNVRWCWKMRGNPILAPGKSVWMIKYHM